MYEPTQNSMCQNDDVKQVPYWGNANIRRYCKKNLIAKNSIYIKKVGKKIKLRCIFGIHIEGFVGKTWGKITNSKTEA